MDTEVTPAEQRLRRLRFRAWHRGTREMDYMMGCFFDRHHAGWSKTDLEWFEALLGEEDPLVMAWAMGTEPVPANYAGPMMDAFKRLDYVEIER